MQHIIDMISNGTKMNESEHDELINEVSAELVELYEIEYDPDNLIPADDETANRILEAAFDLLEAVGVYSVDTKSVFTIPRDEIFRSVQNSQRYLNIGEGSDKYLLTLAGSSEKKKTSIMGGPNASPVTPEMFIPIHRSYAKYTDIDSIAPAYLDVPAGSAKKGPANLMKARQAVQLVKEACALEGRPDMCITTPPHIEDPVAAVSVANPRFMGSGDLQEIIPQQGLKVNYSELSRVYHYKMTGSNYLCSPMLVRGLSAATPEQFAIEIAAEALKSQVVYGASVFFKYPAHIHTGDPLKTLWASFAATQALSKNEICLQGSVVTSSAGPCTEMMFYETAVQTIGYVVCGCDILSGPVSNNGSITNQVSGLDAHFMAEVSRFASDLSLKDANYLCNELFSRYESKLNAPEIGKPFVDCYDMNTIEPTQEYWKLYETVIADIYYILQQKNRRISRR
ncbi:hypothetical protein MmiAt1_12050 [Methanimicrococcus sp. At1]|uniref:[methylamine--corrinoid protein] Co-methyltransferase n=1 Tax=Methanimicrococcus hacksteinii TaxID=3028293 RepID=A0ABU3VQG0_9EURY|nr:monomethylamine:corrinoid methyltransferase [Methanimicrococcus sp. At1]MDV0445616.1 hypothetical protein [Methanimicrococcus sp. At1]